MRLTLLDLDNILIDIVKRYSDLQTYARLKYREEFGSTSLNKTKNYKEGVNANIFYSKKWNNNGNSINKIDFDYPALITFSNDMNFSNLRNSNYQVEIFVCELEAIESKEVWERKTTRIEKNLKTVLDNLKKYVWASVDSGVAQWYNEDVLINAKSEGDITDYKILAYMKSQFKNHNSLNFTRGYDNSPKQLLTIGTTLNIVGCESLDSLNLAFEL